MHALMLAVFSFAGPNEFDWADIPQEGLAGMAAARTARISTRLQGRVMGTFITKGMKREHIEMVLGENRSGGAAALLTAGGVSSTRFYSRLGFNISYFDDRVTRVNFSRLFD